jgi:hypothetical protein
MDPLGCSSDKENLAAACGSGWFSLTRPVGRIRVYPERPQAKACGYKNLGFLAL